MRVTLDWLRDYVDVKDRAENIQDALTMIGLEVTSSIDAEEDRVMDIEITPNRPDCLSLLGVARELAAAKNKPLKIPSSIKKFYMKKGPARGGAKISVLDKKACPRYAGCVIKNVKVGLSPKWLVARLSAMGVRSVNNIVDITNYVLFETGQPLHAFDLDKLQGKKIVVRKAKKSETIVTIDGVRRELDPNMLVIADAFLPVAIAGIMGGKDTEISEGTKNVLLESAYFDPVSIRKTQRKLGLASESSYRFERGVDFSMILAASARAQGLIKEIAGGRVKGTVSDVGGKKIKEKEVALSLEEIPRVLGVEIDAKKVIGFLKRLDLKATKKAKGKISVKIPSYRKDLEKEIDLIEEAVRLYGYENVPVKIPIFKTQKTYEEEKKSLSSLKKEAKGILYSLGLSEVVTYTLTSRLSIENMGMPFEDLVRLQNPLSSNQEFMRPSLLPEMLDVLNWNLNRKNTYLKLFELNKIYRMNKDKGEVEERSNLSIGMCGVTSGNWKEKPRDVDFFDLKGAIIQFLNFLGVKGFVIEKCESFIFTDAMSCCIKIDGNVIGKLGEVKPDIARKFNIKHKIYMAEIAFEELLNYVKLRKLFKSLARYPSIKRDISVLADDSISASSVFDLIREEGKDIVKSVDVFDLYKGQQIEQGKKSLAYTVEYRSDEKTLKDEDVSDIHKKIQEALVKKLGVQIR